MQDIFEYCGNPQDVKLTLSELASDIGLPYFSYLLLRRPSQVSTILETTLLTNYPEEWHKRYLDKRYHLKDPVSELSYQSHLPFSWGSGKFLRNFRKSQRLVFHESKQFGIKHGYSIPVNGPRGDLGVLSVVSPQESDVRDAVRAIEPILQFHAVMAHDHLIKHLCANQNSNVTLTPRERECLLWTAEGKTSDDISEILSVSVSTVNYHLSNTIRKLDACNKHHAAIVAIRAGLL